VSSSLHSLPQSLSFAVSFVSTHFFLVWFFNLRRRKLFFSMSKVPEVLLFFSWSVFFFPCPLYPPAAVGSFLCAGTVLSGRRLFFALRFDPFFTVINRILPSE